MKCPNCDSSELQTTDKFDGQWIDADECCLDFQCDNCECLFQIEYHATATKIIELPEPQEVTA